VQAVQHGYVIAVIGRCILAVDGNLEFVIVVVIIHPAAVKIDQVSAVNEVGSSLSHGVDNTCGVTTVCDRRTDGQTEVQ